MRLRLIRYRGELVVAGRNALMRKLLESGTAQSPRSPSRDDLESTLVATDMVRILGHMRPASSEASSPPLAQSAPQTLYQSPQLPEVFQPCTGWPPSLKVER